MGVCNAHEAWIRIPCNSCQLVPVVPGVLAFPASAKSKNLRRKMLVNHTFAQLCTLSSENMRSAGDQCTTGIHCKGTTRTIAEYITSRSCWIVIGRQSFGSGQGHGGRSGAISTAASQVMASMQVTVAIVSATAMEAATRRMMAD